MEQPSNRLTEIDGLRGWAAIVVLLYHVFWETFGGLHAELRSPYLKFLLDGPLAVYVFFILSGDALATPYLRTGRRELIDTLVLKRYFRLTGPILLSCLLVYGLMKQGWLFHTQAGTLVHRTDWLGAFVPFEPNFRAMLHYALYGVFAEHTVAAAYNPFLWPMGVELIGSLFTASYLYLRERLRHPLRVSLVCALWLFLFQSFYCLFFAGIALAELRQTGYLSAARKHRTVKILAPCALLLVASLEGVLWSQGTLPSPRLYSLMAAIVVLCAYCHASLRAFFSSAVSHFLGNISFLLYVTHFALLVSLTSWLIEAQAAAVQRSLAMPLAIGVVTCAAAIALANAASALDRRYVRLLSRVVRFWVSDRTAPPTKTPS